MTSTTPYLPPLPSDHPAGREGACPTCGHPLEQGADYHWCAHCRTGRFYAACPVCQGDLDASLDPLAVCRGTCRRQWGVPIIQVLPLFSSLPSPDRRGVGGEAAFDQLVDWLAALPTCDAPSSPFGRGCQRGDDVQC